MQRGLFLGWAVKLFTASSPLPRNVAQFSPHVYLLQAIQHRFTLPFALPFHRAATHGISEVTGRTSGQAAHAGDEMHADI